jgi:hypothetical protein
MDVKRVLPVCGSTEIMRRRLPTTTISLAPVTAQAADDILQLLTPHDGSAV